MSDNIRFLYTYTYINLVSVITLRLHALNKEIKKLKKRLLAILVICSLLSEPFILSNCAKVFLLDHCI